MTDNIISEYDAELIECQSWIYDNTPAKREFVERYGDELHNAVRDFFSDYRRSQISFLDYPSEDALVGNTEIQLTLSGEVVVEVDPVDVDDRWLVYDFGVLGQPEAGLCGRQVQMPMGW